MRLSDIIRLGIQYGVVGCAAAVIAVVFIFLAYKLIYQKLFHGTKKLNKWQVLWLVISIAYGVVLVGTTFWSRGKFYEGTKVVPLFASYKEAWYQGRMGNVRNLIINILMFVPFGFWLPLGVKIFRSFWKTTVAGLGVTLLIEVLQLVTNRGIFECDDILNNVVGTIIGYGFFVLGRWLFAEKNKKKTAVKMLLCQLPLILCALIIVVVSSVYNKQELGNLSIHYITRIPTDSFEVVSKAEPNNSEEKVYVYQIKKYTEQETRELAAKILGVTGTVINDNETDYYDDTVFYRGTGKHVSVDYKGGQFIYTDFDAIHSENKLRKIENATEEDVKEALKAFDIIIPDDSTFINVGDGQYTFQMECNKVGDAIYDGNLMCTYMEGGVIGHIHNGLFICTPYRECEIISEAEALKRIQNGEFVVYFPEPGKYKIEIEDIRLGFMIDSKSFYQPVYIFEVTINGMQSLIHIPAVKY